MSKIDILLKNTHYGDSLWTRIANERDRKVAERRADDPFSVKHLELPENVVESLKATRNIVKSSYLGCAPAVEEQYLRPGEIYQKNKISLHPDSYTVMSDVTQKEHEEKEDMTIKFNLEDLNTLIQAQATLKEESPVEEELSSKEASPANEDPNHASTMRERMEDFKTRVEKSKIQEVAEEILHSKSQTAPDLLEDGAAVYRQRNTVYGDSYKRQGLIMDILFPDGISLKTVKDHNRFSVLSTIISKLLRYSHDFENPHDDSVLDNMVYFAMLLELDRNK